MHAHPRSSFVLLTLLVATSIPCAAQAADPDWAIYGWVDYGQVQHSSGYTDTAAADRDKQQPALGLGIRWASGLTIEAGHIRTFDESLTTVTSVNVEGETLVETSRTGISTTFVTMGWIWPIGQTPWSFSVNGGIHRIAFDITRNTSGYSDFADHDVTYGARVDYAINSRWRVGLGWNRFATGYAEYDRSAIRLSYQF